MAMTEDDSVERRSFLDGLAQAFTDDEDIWQFETLAGELMLARTEDDEVVALFDAGSLDSPVDAERVARVAELAAQVGATTFGGRPAAFVCSRRVPSDDAVQAAYLNNLCILVVRSVGENAWGYDIASVSRQQFTQPADADTLSELKWQVVHEQSDIAVFYDSAQNSIATFAGLSATLAWREQAGGVWHFDLPTGTVMSVPGQPPIPITGVTLHFHNEVRPLQAAREAPAFTRQRSRGMPPVELGLDIGGHVDVVDNEMLEVAAEVDVAPVTVDDFQTADFAIADLKAGKVTQMNTGTTELVTLGVLGSHRSSLPHPSRPRHVQHQDSSLARSLRNEVQQARRVRRRPNV